MEVKQNLRMTEASNDVQVINVLAGNGWPHCAPAEPKESANGKTLRVCCMRQRHPSGKNDTSKMIRLSQNRFAGSLSLYQILKCMCTIQCILNSHWAFGPCTLWYSTVTGAPGALTKS